MSTCEEFPLFLSDSPIRFEPLSIATTNAIFFDDANKQVFTVRSNGAGGVVAKGPDSKVSITIRLDDRGELTSIKFSTDLKVLAMQRTPRAVDFISFGPGCDASEYSQTCKFVIFIINLFAEWNISLKKFNLVFSMCAQGKETKIIDFYWTAADEIIYVTDRGIEHYQVIADKKTLKLLKTVSLPINWTVWSSENSMLLVSSGVVGNTMYPFTIKSGTIYKHSKFDLDLQTLPRPGQRSVELREITMATIYGQLCVIQLPSPQSSGSGTVANGSNVYLYQINQTNKEAVASRTDVLRVNATGRLSVSIVDNVIVLHHLQSKKSFLYDIRLLGEVVDGITFHQPLLSPLPVKPYYLQSPAVPNLAGAEVQVSSCELYSQNCVLFQPDVVLDAKLGCFWYIRMKLEPLLTLVTDKCRLMDFLLMRHDSKSAVLSLCADIMTNDMHQSNLAVVSSIFNKLNRVYHIHVKSQQSVSVGLQDSQPDQATSLIVKFCPVIDQSDMYTHVFSQLHQSTEVSYKYVVAVLIEYIRSLTFYQITVQHFLYELIINTLVEHSCFYQLHQFLQYHVLSDSKHLACSLLSLEGAYPPAYQLALDMLKRLQTANDSIVEVLLSKHQLLTALRFVQSVGLSDHISARKFLEAARTTNCAITYFTVFKYFEQRNQRKHGNTKFLPGDHCEPYVEYFQSLFPDAT